MGCFSFLKVMMVVFNGIIFLAGAAILGVGIWVKVDSGSVFNLLGKIKDAPSELGQLLNVGYLLIAVGAVLLIIGFLGCCGAMKESKCMLLIFFIIILVVFIAEVAGAIVILVFRPVAEELLQKVSDAAATDIRKNYGENEDITGLWNATMTTLKCCGFNNASDFINSTYYDDNKSLPSQCCKNNSVTCSENSALEGCFPKIKQLIEDNAVVIVGVGLGIAALEICAMIVSMTLFCKIKSD
ncbi:uncharacterized protein V6R79_017290 [Siganus canaliculatus]